MLPFASQSQDLMHASLLENVSYQSPNVSTLGRFGEVPVGYFTGIPNIAIPIYEAVSGPLKVPVSLNYHAGGVKVEEVASSVGLSWALQAGGMISRSVRGTPDNPGDWDNAPLEGHVSAQMPVPSDEYRRAVENGSIDGEADIYHFNLNGRTGKFIRDQSGNFHIIPKANLIISGIIGGNSPGWTIVDETGTQYLFGKSEMTHSEETSLENSWVLTEIISNDDRHRITFTYEMGFVHYETIVGETKYISLNGVAGGCIPNPPLGVIMGNVNITSQRLTRIDFESGYIEFNYFNERCDVSADLMLDDISIYSKSGTFIKKFVLDHSYFGDPHGCHISQEPTKRLKLNSITEETPLETKPPYIFTYNESTSFPSRFSLSQDHWGYFNNANGGHNTTLIPGNISGPLYNYNLADRSVNSASAQVGILKQIQYPTGGLTKFEYESNTTNYSPLAPTNFETRSLSYIFSEPGYPVVNMPTPLDVTPMVIPAGGATITEFKVTGLDSSPWPNCDISGVYLTKNGVPLGTKLVTTDGPNEFSWHIEEGTYGLTLIHDCAVNVDMPSFSVIIRARFPVNGSANIPKIGGLRVSRIEDVPGDGGESVVREFKYHNEGDVNSSSGILFNIPIYVSNLSVTFTDYTAMGMVSNCDYLVATSQGKVPVTTFSGSHVGYSFVTEVLSNGAENRYSYVNFQGSHYPIAPFAPLNLHEWRRGFLTNVRSYSKVGDKLLLVRQLSNNYTEFDESMVYGVKVGRTYQTTYSGQPPFGTIENQLPPDLYEFYPTYTTFFALGSSIEKIYPEAGNLNKVIEIKKEYTYDPNHFQLIKEKETYTVEDGIKEQKITYRTYPFDYSFSPSESINDPQAAGIKQLQDIHAANAVIEEYVVLQNLDQNQITHQRLVSGVLTTYKADGPYPDEVYQLQIKEPLSLSSFTSSSVENNSFQKSILYKPVVKFLAYDNKGNLITQQKTDDVPVSYLWGYDGTRPVAEVTNAMPVSTTAQFAFSDYATADITEYTSDTPILPSFDINTGQQLISVKVTLASNSSNPPPSPLINLILKTAEGTIVSGINGVWGLHEYSILVNPGVYQWYYSTGDLSFENDLIISLSALNSYSTVKTGSKIFYTSFEDDGNYEQAYYTGEKAWLGAYRVYLPAQNGNYKLTYMQWEGGSSANWHCITQDISVTSGTVQEFVIGNSTSVIDEVRLYPSDAKMTTYSYKPEFGITSQADSNSVVVYYDYDSFGRLKYLKDHRRNILKSYDYHYKGQY